MALWVKDTGSVPSEGWQFVVEATGFSVRAPNYNAIFDFVKTHCASNNVSYPGDQAVIDQMCARLHVDCREGREPFVNAFSQGLPTPAPRCCGGK